MAAIAVGDSGDGEGEGEEEEEEEAETAAATKQEVQVSCYGNILLLELDVYLSIYLHIVCTKYGL